MALKDCSFRLDKGEFLFLTGASGAGKSTLLRLLFADLALQRGEAAVAGFQLRRIRSADIPRLRRRVSIVFQDFKILPQRTAYDNIILPLQARGMDNAHAHKRVMTVARALGLEKKIHALCADISGGEQQRVAVARAFVVNPRIMLADEPTGNLDPELSLLLMELFKKFQQYGTTLIVATHSPFLLASHPGARVMRLDNGMITQANWSGAVLHQFSSIGPSADFNRPRTR